MLSAVTLLALLASAQGRAVNISNTWVLPEEGFPVFYRYFRDRISWYEADAVCQFHHANLVTVDTTAQYDAVRAYLKELDISSAVWVGLIRSNPDGDFTWTDYRGLSGEGYWSSAPDARTAPLCAAANPAADYRWEARACGGPTVASFICELPVPRWALGNEGCMVRELPALTILYLPESAAVQLTADCGMAGVKRVQCTGNVKREDLLKELSCNDEEELSSTSSASITEVSWPITSTDITVTDQDVTSDITTEESVVPERNETEKQFNISQSTPIPYTPYTALDLKQPIKVPSFKNFNNVLFEKHIDLNVINKNNMQSNDIPKIAVDSNYLTEEQLDKIEDEKNKHHKMIHEEFAKHGNFENIFTQPTDHFVPPLVMAKAKLSDDMTVLSLEEKHAQQLAEHKQVIFNSQHNKYMTMNKTSTDKSKLEIVTDAPNIPPATIAILKEKGKKVIIKNTVPKKYNDPKNKVLKSVEVQNNKIGKFVELSTQSSSTTKEFETSTSDTVNQDGKQDESDDTIDLKVIIKDDPIDQHTVKPVFPNYSGDITKLEVMSNDSVNSREIAIDHTSSSPITVAETADIIQNNAMIHEIINITIITENKSTVSPIVFEITTKIPAFETNLSKIQTLTTPQPSESKLNFTTEFINLPSSMNTGASDIKNITSTTPLQAISTVAPPTSTNVNADNGTSYTIFAIDKATTEFPVTATTIQNLTQNSIQKHNESTPVNANSSTENVLFNESIDLELEHNSTDSIIDDFQSPLLSAASEPLHRPNRSRRPQQPNRTKFNPFRILG